MVYNFLMIDNVSGRFGVGQYDWAEFTPRMKQKTYEEIKEYAIESLLDHRNFCILGC